MRSHLFLLGLGLAACNGKDPSDSGTDTDSGEDAPGALSVDCSGIDFGNVAVNSITSTTIKANNTAAGEISIDAVTVDAPFMVAAATPIPVQGGATYQFTVRFNPTTFGDFSGTMTVDWSTLGEAQTPITCTLEGAVDGDGDHDGYISADAGGDDCDDDDSAVNPGATEVWYDGLDQNCDDDSDFDQDHDGYESKVFNEDASSGGGDCQDADALINPDTVDVPYDGIDSDCSGGSDYDMDGDGYTTAAYGGTDCNDDEPTVNPVATETFDGLDNDCDGVPDDGATADGADVLVTGANADDGAGNSVAVGDFDNDGQTDLVVGVWGYNPTGVSTGTAGDYQGAVSIFMDESWTDGDDVTNGSNYIEGANSADEFGRAVADIGDYDGDGYNDLAVGAPAYNSKYGRVYVYSGADIEAASVTSALFTYSGKDDYQIGTAMMTDTDLNGDGASDLIAFGINSWDVYNYLTIEYGGGMTGDSSWTDIDATFRMICGTTTTGSTAPYCGPPTTGKAGGTETWANSAGRAEDIDGDGYVDLVVGDQYNDEGAKNAGKVWILWGKSSKYSVANGNLSGTATTLVEGDSVKDLLGKAVGSVGDVDGDGFADIFVQNGDTDDLYLVHGSPDLRSGAIDLATDSAAVLEMPSDTITGWSQIGDWTGDGKADFAIGYGEDNEIWMYAGQDWSGTYTGSTSITASILGGDLNDAFGIGLAPLGYDMNGDGRLDLAVGDNGYDSGKGSMQLFYQP